MAAAAGAADGLKVASAPADPGTGLLFHASFDKDRRADAAAGAEYPQMALYARQDRTAQGGALVDGVFGKAINGKGGRYALGNYDALGNIMAERGTVAFHVRQRQQSYGFEPLMLNTVDPYYWNMYLRITYEGAVNLSAWFPNEVYRPQTVSAAGARLEENTWHHIALAWDQAYGARLYFDGREAGSTWGRAAWTSRGVDPDMLTPAWHDGVDYDELYVFDRPLTAAQIARLALENQAPAELPPLEFTPEHRKNRLRELSWATSDPGMIQADMRQTGPGANTIRQIIPSEARAVMKDCSQVFDGKLGNGWPPLLNYEFNRGNGMHILVEEPYDQVQVEGYFKGSVYDQRRLEAAGPPYKKIDSAMFMYRWALEKPRDKGWLSFFKEEMEDRGAHPDKELVTTSRICEISFFRKGAGDLGGVTTQRFYLGGADITQGSRLLGPEFFGRFGSGDRAALEARDTPPQHAGGQAVPALRYHHVLLPTAGAVPLRGLRLALWLQGSLEDNMVRVEVRDPLLPARRLFACDYAMAGTAGTGPQCLDLTLDTADRLLADGKPLWMTLCFLKDVDILWLGNGRYSFVERLDGTQAEILPEYLRTELAFMKSRFRALSEPRPWVAYREPENELTAFNRLARELFDPLVRLRQYMPADPKVQAIWYWTHKQAEDTTPVAPAPVAGCANAPRWALLQRELLRSSRGIFEWWIANRQTPNGEFGDDWGDDTDLVQNFPGLILMGDTDQALTRALKRTADGVYLAGRIRRGINARLTDTLHAYEEGVNAQAAMFLADYGNPLYVERLMEAAKTVDEFLTAKDAKGRRRFRSSYFSASAIRDKGVFGADYPGNALFCHPALCLAYYSRHPQALRFLQEWIDGWLDYYATAQPPNKDKPYPMQTLMDGSVISWDSKVRGYGYVDCYAALWELTGAARYREATRFWTGAGGPGKGFMRGSNYLPALEMLDREKWKAHLAQWAEESPLQFVGSDELGGAARERYMKYEITGEESAAYEALEACVRKIRLTYDAFTWAEPINDRIWAPDKPLVMMAQGEIAHVRNQTWPRHYASYSGFSDFAAWVRKKSNTHLLLWLYSFAGKPETGEVRVWRTPLGEYAVAFGPDRDGDGYPEDARPEKLTLHRDARITLTMPPRALCALEIRLVTKSEEDFWKRPDLAIGPEDIAAGENGAVVVVVHNIGGGAARNAVVRMADNSGAILGERRIASLEAPLDFVPRTATVVFNPPARAGSWRIEADPDNAIAELNERNNTVRNVR